MTAKPSRRGKLPRVTHTTPFANWRRQVGLSLSEAANALGKSVHAISVIERGARYDGAPSVPNPCTLRLMQAIVEGFESKAWEDRHP